MNKIDSIPFTIQLFNQSTSQLCRINFVAIKKFKLTRYANNTFSRFDSFRQNMRGRSQKNLSRLAFRLRQGGMRMNAEGHIFSQGSHFNSQNAFRNQPLGMPTGYLIDRTGTVRLIHQGYRKSDGVALRAEIIELLGE